MGPSSLLATPSHRVPPRPSSATTGRSSPAASFSNAPNCFFSSPPCRRPSRYSHRRKSSALISHFCALHSAQLATRFAASLYAAATSCHPASPTSGPQARRPNRSPAAAARAIFLPFFSFEPRQPLGQKPLRVALLALRLPANSSSFNKSAPKRKRPDAMSGRTFLRLLLYQKSLLLVKHK